MKTKIVATLLSFVLWSCTQENDQEFSTSKSRLDEAVVMLSKKQTYNGYTYRNTTWGTTLNSEDMEDIIRLEPTPEDDSILTILAKTKDSSNSLIIDILNPDRIKTILLNKDEKSGILWWPVKGNFHIRIRNSNSISPINALFLVNVIDTKRSGPQKTFGSNISTKVFSKKAFDRLEKLENERYTKEKNEKRLPLIVPFQLN